MSTILGNLKWGEKALTFLNKPIKMIQPDKPAIIYLRHSKADYSKFEKPSDGTLTEEGEKAALEFGELLPRAQISLPSGYPVRLSCLMAPI